MSEPDVTRHVPVLGTAIREAFTCSPGRILDATAGGGGHSRILLDLGHVVSAVDRDPGAIAGLRARFCSETAAVPPRLVVYQMPFSGIAALGSFDGFLADLGFSSDQMDSGARGFSFDSEAEPDMRMSGEGATAADLIESSSAATLTRIIRINGEERAASRIARAIAGRRFCSCRDLADAVRDAKPRPRGRQSRIHPATLTFQALRIAVNDELGELERLLAVIPEIVNPGARIALISFHSLEDRLVKRKFAEWTKPCRCPPQLPACVCSGKPLATPIWKGGREAEEDEIDRNPRARSARIRAVAWC